MEASFDCIDSELMVLQEQESRINIQLAAGCQQLLDEFRRRYPPLKRVSELVIRTDTLQKWIEGHREQHS